MEFFGHGGTRIDFGRDANRPARASISGHWKLLEIADSKELYDIEADPGETKNRASVWPQEVSRISTTLPPLDVRSDRLRRGEGTLEPDAVEALRAIGYVE